MPPRHSLEREEEARQEHAAIAYQVAGEWNIRLGAPVGVTRYGHLVFEPIAFNDGAQLGGIRLTIEHQPTEVAVLKPGEAEIGLYRRLGLGKRQQTALLADPQELRGLASAFETTAMKVEPLNQALKEPAPHRNPDAIE